MKSLSAFRLISLFASAAVLAACGGGGGGGSSTPPPATTFTVGGTLAGLASGTSVVLQNNAGSNLTVSANGTFTFATAVASGGAYAVTVLTQPTNQTCTVTSGSGTVTANVTNVAVTCVTSPANTFTVSATVSGLASGATVVLQNSGGSNLSVSANGTFPFATAVASGGAYSVAVLTQPSNQICTPTAPSSGTVTANTTVAVTCVTSAPGTFAVGGTVSGLAAGGTVVLRNNGGNNLSVGANGAFTFTTPIATGAAYAVTVLTQPTVPGAPASPTGQTCTVTNGSGTVASAAITNVAIACANNDTSVPTVTVRSPLTNAVGSKVQGGVVTVTFSEAVNPATVTVSSFTLASTTGAVPGTVSLASGNTQAIFTPTSPLSFDQNYTATLTTAVRDGAGNALANTTWSFNSGKKIAVGFEHTCVRLQNGSVKCWGYNSGDFGIYGQLGYDATYTSGTDPAPVEPETYVDTNLAAVNLGVGRTAVSIVAGDFHTCAILDNGDTKCWGSNDDGELGQGSLANQLDSSNPPGTSHGIGDEATDGTVPHIGEMARLLPITFGGGHKAIEIVGGQFFTCARLDDNTVKCFGKNDFGQLGLGNTTPLRAPGAAIDFGPGVTPISISAGHFHACAILQNNTTAAKTVKCWGGNQWGQLGLGDTNNRGDGPNEMGTFLPPVLLGANRSADYLLATGGTNCAILDNKATKCWGLNTWGQVGLLAGNGDPAPGAAQLVCNDDHNDCIGDEPNEVDNTTVAIAAGTTNRLAIGFRHACVTLIGSGLVKCWGSNEQGQLGLGNNTGTRNIVGNDLNEMGNLATTSLKTGTVIGEISAGGLHTCVWNTNGNELNCWGNNSRGQLGHNDTYGFPPTADFPGNYWGAGNSQMGNDMRNTNVGL